MTATLRLVALEGIGRVTAGTDLAATVLAAYEASDLSPRDDDVLVVASKIVSKAEGRGFTADQREELLAAETVRVVAERVGPRGLTQVVLGRGGPVQAAAGIDASNTTAGTILALPIDADASARDLRAQLQRLTGCRLGVVITDTAGRPWREGQTDIALGAAGVEVVQDLRGGVDADGRPLEVTVRALADEFAAAADLVKGKSSGRPVALVRGLPAMDDDGPGAASLVRAGAGDWFRHGHVEAVRASLGVPPGTGGPPPRSIAPEGERTRMLRAAAVAVAAPDPLTGQPLQITVTEHPDGVGLGADDPTVSDAALGALAQRLTAALWSEDLAARLSIDHRAVVAQLIHGTGTNGSPITTSDVEEMAREAEAGEDVDVLPARRRGEAGSYRS